MSEYRDSDGGIKMSSEKHPIAVDKHYKIKDNQFWYNDCKFRNHIENKEIIVINIEGLGTRTLKHSRIGTDRRTTLSYKFPSLSDRFWWKEHRGELVRVELLGIED